MKKKVIVISLFVVAVGVAAYFMFFKKKNGSSSVGSFDTNDGTAGSLASDVDGVSGKLESYEGKKISGNRIAPSEPSGTLEEDYAKAIKYGAVALQRDKATGMTQFKSVTSPMEDDVNKTLYLLRP
jgi:hypothetical protein